jgi:Fe-Mn family superoxide dismutase
MIFDHRLWGGTSSREGRLQRAMFSLPPLPYDLGALAPVMSARTLELHYGAHHAAYVKKANALVKERGLEGASLEDVVRRARELGEASLFNQAAQAWNHAFFWNAMAPPATRTRSPEGPLREALERAFGDVDAFRSEFIREGESHFASGWIWLAFARDGSVRLLATHDANTPIGGDFRPLAVCDLWEHAYYLDHQNRRSAFLESFIDRLINWTFAESQYGAFANGDEGWRHPPPAS